MLIRPPVRVRRSYTQSLDGTPAEVFPLLCPVREFAVTRLDIRLRPDGAARTHADVTYTYTALGPEGEEYVPGRTEEAYAAFMREWEDGLNAYLRASRADPLSPA